MVDFVNNLKLSEKKYQANGIVIDDNYNGRLLFLMNKFVTFGTDTGSMYFMSTRFLEDNIYGVCVLKFQLYYICGTTHPSY